jgi:hypothetical protein
MEVDLEAAAVNGQILSKQAYTEVLNIKKKDNLNTTDNFLKENIPTETIMY